MTPLDIKPDFDEPSFRKTIQPLINCSLSSITFQTAHQHKNGQRIPVEIFLQYVAAGNESGRFVAIVRDIAEQQKAEEALRKSEERLELALKGADLGLWDWDVESGKVTFNERWAQMLGYELEEIEPNVKTWEKLVHPDDMPKVMETLSAHMEGKTPFYETEHRVLTKSGEWKWILDRGKIMERDSTGKPIRATGTHMDIDGRKLTEQALLDSEQRIKSIVENIVDGIFSINSRGTIESVNPAAVKIFGYSSNELIGKNVKMIMPSPDREHHDGYLRRYMETGEGTIIGIGREVTGRKKDGTLFPLELAVNRMYSGENTKFVGIMRDITERKAFEKKLKKSQANLEDAQRLARIGNWEWDLFTGQVFWSDETFRIFGRESGEFELNYESYMESVHPDDVKMLKQRIEKSLQDKETYVIEYRILTPDGSVRWVEGKGELSYDENGEPLRIFGTVQDITDRKLVQERSALLASIVESTGDAVIGKTLDFKILSWNKAAERMFGYSVGEVRGKSVSILMTPEKVDSEMHELMSRVHRGERIDRYETERIRKDGSRFDVSVTISPITDANAKIVGVSSIARDISREKEIERMKNDFVSSVSHELRTPLTSIQGYVSMILDGDTGEINELQTEFLEIVSLSSERLGNLINDLLDIERIESGKIEMKMERIDLSAVLDLSAKTMMAAAEQKGLSLISDIEEDISIDGDKDKLTQVAVNLLSNAIKFTREGEVSIALRKSDDEILINVEDTGVGISLGDQEQLFEKFFRSDDTYVRNAGGTGLGLSIVKTIVESHNGRIDIDSELGKGSRFSISFPAS